MDAHLYLVLDQGGHSSRALVFDAAGDMLAQATQPVTAWQPQPGWVEQSPQGLLDSLKRAAAQALQQLQRHQLRRVAAAALVTQRASLLCWRNSNGEPLHPVISWQDRRAADWLQQQSPDNSWLQQRTGLTLNPHYGASKIRWCLDHLDQVRQAHRADDLCCAPLASWLINQLTATRQNRVDPANASRTMLWNITTRNWDDELLDYFGIERGILPRLTPTESYYGDLSVDGVRIPLKLVNGDQSAALFAYGLPLADTAYINAGTGAFIARPLAEAAPCPPGLLKSLVHDGVTRWFVAEGTVNGAASALDWARQVLGIAADDEADGPVSEPYLPLFMNGIAGLGSPFWCALQPTFVGEGNPRQKLHAVKESILFLLRVNLLALQQVGDPVRRCTLAGGLARNDAFCQKWADLNMIPVERPAQVEASARGAAFWLAGCPSDWKPLATKTFVPSLSANEILSDRFQRWHHELLARLAPG